MRLIDSDELVEEIESLRITCGGKDYFTNITKDVVLRIIDEQPTINAQEAEK